ncbi:MAG: arginine--tRNA ligase [Chloroflexota bacterium]
MSLDPLSDFDREILEFLQSCQIDPERVQIKVPPQREFGERSLNVFPLAKERRRPPQEIASELIGAFDPHRFRFIAEVQRAGAGFVNFYLRYDTFVPHVMEAVASAGSAYGKREGAVTERIVVEHTSVNPNKEWHIGHVRNAVLGDVIARLLTHIGHDVQVQNYIDDTGLQAAQAVFAFERFPEPAAPGEKFDQLVGRSYVKISAELGAERDLKERLERVREADDDGGSGERRSLEARVENIRSLQKDVLHTMHALERGKYHPILERILNGQLQTAYRLGIFYQLLSWESHLVQSHIFDAAVERLCQASAVSRPKDGRYAGALVIHTGHIVPDDEEPKAEVLIRSNGIPTYVGKDIVYHIWKFGLLPDPLSYVEYTRQPNGETLYSTSMRGDRPRAENPDRVINIIGVHQSQAQDTVQAALRAAGFAKAAGDLFHLAYGMVSTSEGKISGRKGTAVSGDSVIDQAVSVAYERATDKRSADLSDDEMRSIAEAVGVGAVRYFMVQYNPLRDIVFDVADVVSFDGNTGLYVQYALVRTFALLRRAEREHGIDPRTLKGADTALLQHEQERRLVYHISQYPEMLATAARTLAVNLVAEYAYDLATIFSQFYRDCGVLNAEPEVRRARLLLVQTVRDVLTNVCGILGIPVIERL